jgi:MFS family permease
MNLNKRTFLIGFAFFTILMLWQIYNYYCPLFLKELLISNFGNKDYNYLVGIIMALDNILALFMLPIFGTLSDKTKSRFGKRMPYIVVGTTVSLMAFPFISLLFIHNSLIGVAIMMGLILIAMNIYRAPAVALMPDLTPKPKRAKANAIINFVGYIGAIIGSVLTMIFTKYNSDLTLVKNVTIWPFVITSVFMLAALIVLVLKIKENKILNDVKEELELGEKQSETHEAISVGKHLSKIDKTNLWLLIVSIFLWFFAFNAVETFGSTYAKEVLHTESWGLATSLLAISSLITFLPSAYLSKKIGRKNSVMLGLAVMIVSLGSAYFVTNFGVLLIVLFALAGAGWAIINVNSYPMFVELSNSKNIGKFTGYYYASSQIAQSITPIVIGFVLDLIGLKAYFPYAGIFMVLALSVFVFVKTKKKS